MIELVLLLIGLLLCIALSAFFSASEMSISSCNTIRLENLKDDGNKKADIALKVTSKFEDALSAILIGNNLVNIAASSIASVIAIELNADRFTWIATIIVTILVIVFGETIPKISAKKNATRFALTTCRFIRILMIILKPIIFIVVNVVFFITKFMKPEEESDDDDEAIDELQSIIETAEDESVLDEDQSELVKAAIDFIDISAFEAMTSRVDIVSIDIDDDLDDIIKLCDESHYSRIPVYHESIDNVIGIMYLNHFYKALAENEKLDINSLLMKPCYVYKTTKLTSVLEQLKAAKQHLAIVCDEYGGTLGIITMEDILEQIVGEIWDESDIVEEDDVNIINDTDFELDGDVVISEFCDLMGFDEDEFETESDTVGGWTLEHFEHYPNPQDFFIDEENEIKVTVLGIKDRRIEKILVHRDPTIVE